MRLATLAIALVCSAAGRAAAQPAAAEAESLFHQGKDLMAAGKLAEACSAFEASQKAEAAVSTLLNLANCREKNGQLATAWGLFIEAERQTRSATDAAGKQMHATAADRAAKLEAKVPKLTITVGHRIDGLEIRRDGNVVDAIMWGRSLPIDGGSHTIEARAPGHTKWTKTITVLARDDSQRVFVPELEPEATTTAEAHPREQHSHEQHPHEQKPHEEPQPPPETPGERHGRGLAPWIVSASALALGGAAVGFELSARSTYDSSVAATDPVMQTSLYNTANDRRYIADGLAVGAVVFGGVAVWLFVRGGDSGAPTAASVQPVIGPGHAGLAWTGAW